jgi:hypothetical protein
LEIEKQGFKTRKQEVDRVISCQIVDRMKFIRSSCLRPVLKGRTFILAGSMLMSAMRAMSGQPVAEYRYRIPVDTAILPRQTMTEIRRSSSGAAPEQVYVTDAGRQGVFVADAADQESPDDSAMTLVGPGGRRFKRVTLNGIVDARWFGAIPGDGRDDADALQRALDFCTANGNRYTTVHLSPGVYVLSHPILLYNWTGRSYGFHSTSLEGEASFWESSGNGTILQCTFKDRFAIGVQLGKGNRISRLRILGGFKPPFRDKFSFYQTGFDEFRDPSCRDTNFSPFSAIVIDPFSNSTEQVPADGGYPGYSSWYRGSGGMNGSTGITIEDVAIDGFVVGVCSSPNSFTRNAELTYINKIQFSNTKLCISGSQDQEKGNVVTNLGCWGTTHTIFATGLYGAHTPGNWYIENCNIAGYVNRLVFNQQGGYFASHFRNIFAESLGRLGTILSSTGSTFESSELGFAYYHEHLGQYLSPQIETWGVTFIGCDIRMYGTFKPVTLSGAATYIGCSFEAVPFCDYLAARSPSFVNCLVGDATLGLSGVKNMYGPDAWRAIAYGSWCVADGTDRLSTDNAAPALTYPIHLTGEATRLVSSAKDGIRSATIPLRPDEKGRVREGDIISTHAGDKVQGVLGTVTAVTDANFTVSYLPSWAVDGQSYYLSVFLPLYTMSFLGDMTAGSDRITNVKSDFGQFEPFIRLGGLMLCSRLINTEYNQTWRGSLFRIVAYDAASHTVTLDQRATQSGKGVYFSNTNAIKDVHVENFEPGFGYLDKYAASEILQEGGHLFSRDATTGKTLRYLVTKSGYYNAAANHDTRQAEWVAEDKH